MVVAIIPLPASPNMVPMYIFVPGLRPKVARLLRASEPSTQTHTLVSS